MRLSEAAKVDFPDFEVPAIRVPSPSRSRQAQWRGKTPTVIPMRPKVSGTMRDVQNDSSLAVSMDTTPLMVLRKRPNTKNSPGEKIAKTRWQRPRKCIGAFSDRLESGSTTTLSARPRSKSTRVSFQHESEASTSGEFVETVQFTPAK